MTVALSSVILLSFMSRLRRDSDPLDDLDGCHSQAPSPCCPHDAARSDASTHGGKLGTCVSISKTRRGLPRSDHVTRGSADTARPGMTAQRDDRCTGGGDPERNAVERLAEECAIPKERDVLLGPLVATHPAGQRSQSHALTPGENDAPELSRRWCRRLDFDEPVNSWLTARLRHCLEPSETTSHPRARCPVPRALRRSESHASSVPPAASAVPGSGPASIQGFVFRIGGAMAR